MDVIPNEIIREHIIPYTYVVQDINLLTDIKEHFIVKNKIVISLKKNYYIIKEILTINELFFSKLFDFLNGSNGEKDIYINIVKRLLPTCKNETTINIKKKINKIHNRYSIDSIINLLWGAMLPNERRLFMHFVSKSNI